MWAACYLSCRPPAYRLSISCPKLPAKYLKCRCWKTNSDAQQPANSLMHSICSRCTITRAVHKVTEFFLSYCLTYNLIKLVSFKVLPFTLDPNVLTSSGTRPGTCFAGWREGPLSNFLLSPLPSEIGDLLVRISTTGTRKSPQGPNLESRGAGARQSSLASPKIHG